jgi:chemotaxis protein methyltransferase CheR
VVESPDRSTTRNAAWTLIRDLIHERAGIYFDANSLDLMMNKISDLMAERGVDSPIDYYYLLKYEEQTSDEWPNLLNAISVRETYFWREIDQIRALVDVIVPEVAKTSREPLRIWSAACASGEEPYSIAMALDLAGWFHRIPIEIYATDMSVAAVCALQRGIYRERSFRNLPLELRERYFTEVPRHGWELAPEIRRRVLPRRANLTERADIQDLARARAIFCRNVFIYFSDAMIRKVVKTFEESMPKPGYLFLGAAESLLKFTTQFRLQEIGRAFVYIKD